MSEYENENPELEALVAEAEGAAEVEPGQHEELTQSEEDMAAESLASAFIKGLEKGIQLRYPHFQIEEDGHAHGVECLKPVTADFVGDMPEWLTPYAKYLSAGLFIGGCVFEAHRQEKLMKQEEEKARGNQSTDQMAQPA